MAKKIKDTANQMGQHTLVTCERFGTIPELFVRKVLHDSVQIPMPNKQGVMTQMTFIPGGSIDGVQGPQPGTSYSVMVVSTMPGNDEQREDKAFAGTVAAVLESALNELEYAADDWYFTNVVRFTPPGTSKGLAKVWIDECRYFLMRELELINPDCLLLLGAEAVKAFFGRKATLKKYRGVEGVVYNDIPVIVANSPTAVAAEPKLRDGFIRDLRRIETVLQPEAQAEKHPVNYEVIRTEARLAEVVDALQGVERLVVDCEWGGSDATEGSDWPKGKLRTIQFSAEPYVAYCVALRGVGLVDAFEPSVAVAYPHLRRLIEQPQLRLCGHSIPSDMKWITSEIGADCEKQVAQGFDTMLAHHLLKPHDEAFNLESLLLQHTDLGRYDREVAEWLENEVTVDQKKVYLRKYGYANVPDEVLHPYSMRDVDGPMRVWEAIEAGLAAYEIAEPFVMPGAKTGIKITTLKDFYMHILQPSNIPFNEMETVGILADRDRLVGLVELFALRREEMEAELRTLLNWEDFNVRSYQHVRELLFGVMPTTGRKSPEHIQTMNLFPVKTTGTPSRDWNTISEKEQRSGQVSPSTDAETVQVLMKNPVNVEHIKTLDLINKLKGVDQICKNFLRQPELSPYSPNPEWIGGLVAEIDPDGHIRTTLLQLTDTGRASSSHPNLQNLPKRQEAQTREAFSSNVAELHKVPGWADVPVQVLKDKGVMHPGYYTIRSGFMATPGYVLIESDYSQAELNVLAKIANDPAMIEVMNDLSRDLHSEMAINAFKLTCEPGEVKKLYGPQRVLAKAVNFGIAYGRGPKALVRAAQAEGVDIEEKAARLLIDTFYSQFPRTKDFFGACHKAVTDPGYVETAMGRRRWFPETDSESIIAAYKREAGNMPIQGTVADALLIALWNLHAFRKAEDLHYRMVLTIHDAVILEVPWYEVTQVCNTVLPVCMSLGARIPTIDLTLRIDTEAMDRWGEKVGFDEAAEAAKNKVQGKYVGKE